MKIILILFFIGISVASTIEDNHQVKKNIPLGVDKTIQEFIKYAESIKNQLKLKNNEILQAIQAQLNVFITSGNYKIDNIINQFNNELDKLTQNSEYEKCIRIIRPQIKKLTYYKTDIKKCKENGESKTQAITQSVTEVINDINKNINKLYDFLDICSRKLSNDFECTVEKGTELMGDTNNAIESAKSALQTAQEYIPEIVTDSKECFDSNEKIIEAATKYLENAINRVCVEA